MTEHIDDLAELYALGDLDLRERAVVESHVRSCAICEKRLHDAEAAVLALAQQDDQHEPPAHLMARLDASLALNSRRLLTSWMLPLLAVAAVLVIAIVPLFSLFGSNRRMRAELATENAAFARIAAGSFDHASFKGHAIAKVLYSADGAWYYVIVMHPVPGMHVAYVHNGTMEDLGSVAARGTMGTLYLPVNHKMEELALVENGREIADANLAY